jgi:benzoate/toluate 1,2-dioxygenase subunit beta
MMRQQEQQVPNLTGFLTLDADVVDLNPAGHSASLSLAECEALLLHEAELLDDGKFEDWLALFTANAWYWVPIEPNQESPVTTVSLMYDDRRLLETRVRRLTSPRMHAQEPRSRTSRIVANVTLRERRQASSVVRSKFMMVEYRRGDQRLFAGTCFHELVRTEEGVRIASKRVDLVNCDAALDGLVVPF